MDEDGDDEDEARADDEDPECHVVQDRTVIERGDNSSGVFREHKGPVFCAALDPTGTVAVTGSEDDMAMVWRVDNGQKLFECKEFADSVTFVAFNFDGSLLATASMDGVIIIWTCSSGSLLCRFECGDDLTFIDWHPLANFIIAGTGSGCVHMWEVPRGTLTFFNPHVTAITAGRWLPDGRMFVTAAEDGSMIVTSPKTQLAVCKFDATVHQFLTCPITCLDAHPDNTRVCVGGQDGTSRVVQIKTNKVINTFEGHTESVERVAFSRFAGPSLVASASLDHTVRVFDISSSLQVCVCTLDAGCAGVLFHMDLPVMYVWSLDGTTRIFDPRSGTEVKVRASLRGGPPGTLQHDLESLAHELVPIHSHDRGICRLRVVKAHKPKAFALICLLVDVNFGTQHISKGSKKTMQCSIIAFRGEMVDEKI